MNTSIRAAVSNTTTTAVTVTPTTSLSEFVCGLVIEGRAVVLTGVLIMIGAFVERAIELAWSPVSEVVLREVGVGIGVG